MKNVLIYIVIALVVGFVVFVLVCGNAKSYDATVQLAWDPYPYAINPDVKEIRLYEINYPDTTNRMLLASVPVMATSFAWIIHFDNKTHYFVATAVDNSGNESGLSNIASIYLEVPDVAPPGKVTNLRILIVK